MALNRAQPRCSVRDVAYYGGEEDIVPRLGELSSLGPMTQASPRPARTLIADASVISPLVRNMKLDLLVLAGQLGWTEDAVLLEAQSGLCVIYLARRTVRT